MADQPKRCEYSTTPKAVRAGLNNQRIAILGLCAMAIATQGQVRIPHRLVDFSARREGLGRVDAAEVFDTDALFAWLRRQNLLGGDPDSYHHVNWVDCFSYGAQIWEDPQQEDFVADFLRAMRGAAPLRVLASNLVAALGSDIGYIQLRIEQDWQDYARAKMASGRRGFLLDPSAIFEKIVATPETASYRRWFAFCDLAALPWNIETIKNDIRRQFGLDLLFKPDIAHLFSLPSASLANASLDFEMALTAPIYVGLRQSTFSNLVHATRLAETPATYPNHFLYCSRTKRMPARQDRGRGKW
ncbi:hypothetical protein [Sphingobium scionense]|uniref:Uncharacterized protein n=1 Tax=Sphingobium scionense TaxID=1404341 RepID=A0A7W6LTB1_9SPHN|nr:hypothetical protein [Sphingobium scionense]MBB4149288.1 hypothetical protein [Sphingobium scionense]